MTVESVVLTGVAAVEAALQAGSREIFTIYVQAQRLDSTLLRVEQLATAVNIPVQHLPAATLAAHSGREDHGGLVALTGPRRYRPLAELFSLSAQPFLVMLEGIEDPFNFGHAVRALYAAGADGLVVRPRNWSAAAGVVARASAGASELMPTAVAGSAEEVAHAARANGLLIAGTAKEKTAVSLYSADLSGPLFLAVGGEKRGLSRAFRQQADLLLQIPYGRPFAQAIGAVGATAVLAFEVMRQRRAFTPKSR